MHTVLANNKKYVGQSSGDPHARWGSSGHRYRGQMFYDAILKYGWDNIKHEIIADDLTQEEADLLEKEYIAKFKTNQSEYGYNITPGGKDGAGSPGGKNPNARAVTCIETGEVWECSTYCAKAIGVNLASLQESLYNGYKCKDKHFKYVDDDNYVVNKEPHGVVCKETGQIWQNVKECAKDLGIHHRSVARYCTGIRRPASGLTYEYCIV